MNVSLSINPAVPCVSGPIGTSQAGNKRNYRGAHGTRELTADQPYYQPTNNRRPSPKLPFTTTVANGRDGEGVFRPGASEWRQSAERGRLFTAASRPIPDPKRRTSPTSYQPF